MRDRLITLAGRTITVAIEVTWSARRPHRSAHTPIVTVDADLRTGVRAG